MAKTPKTLYDLDFTKYTTNFDPSIMAQEFTRAFSQFQVPGVDVNAIIASQQKNLDALTAANQTAIEGIRAVVTRQAEIMQQTMLATASAIEAMTKSGSPQDASVKQSELVKSTFEKALADMTEIADMVARSNLSASAAINKRLSESLDEVKKLAQGIK
jgi:phasin family protein